jgi:hypothetical protein
MIVTALQFGFAVVSLGWSFTALYCAAETAIREWQTRAALRRQLEEMAR